MCALLSPVRFCCAFHCVYEYSCVAAYHLIENGRFPDIIVAYKTRLETVFAKVDANEFKLCFSRPKCFGVLLSRKQLRVQVSNTFLKRVSSFPFIFPRGKLRFSLKF